MPLASRTALTGTRAWQGNDAAPLSGQGVLIELVQAPPDVIEALS